MGMDAGQYRSFRQVILTQQTRAGAKPVPPDRQAGEGFVSGAADPRPPRPAAYWDVPFGVIGVFDRGRTPKRAVWPGRTRRGRMLAKTVVKKK